MKEKKNIDRLFQEKFRDFETPPGDRVWKNIKKGLDGTKKPQRRLLPLWSKIVGAAALVVLLFLVGRSVFFTSSTPSVVHSPEKNIEQPSSPTAPQNSQRGLTQGSKSKDSISRGRAKGYAGGQADGEHKETDPSQDKMKAAPNERGTDVESGLAADRFSSETGRQKGHQEDETQIAVRETPGARKIITYIEGDTDESTDLYDGLGAYLHSPVALDLNIGNQVDDAQVYPKTESGTEDSTEQNELSLEEIAKNRDRAEEEDTGEHLKNRFSIRPNMAPIFYNSTSGGSPVDPKFEDNAGQSETTTSYGVNLAYAVSKRLKIRTGLSRVKMGYNTKDIAFTSTAQLINLKGLQEGPRAQHLMVTESATELKTQKTDMLSYRRPYEEGKLNQQYEYIEVPVEVQFALLNERFGINLIGGFSTLFLNNDEITIISPNGRTGLGQANNLNSVSFTTNLGVGFDYDLSKWMIFNVEPTFKYQLNAFNGDTGGFHPYYFGIYTGLIFRF